MHAQVEALSSGAMSIETRVWSQGALNRGTLPDNIFAVSESAPTNPSVIELSGEYTVLKTPQALETFVKLPLSQGKGDEQVPSNAHELWRQTHFATLAENSQSQDIPQGLPLQCWQHVNGADSEWAQYAAKFRAYALQTACFPVDSKGNFAKTCCRVNSIDNYKNLCVYAPTQYQEQLRHDPSVNKQYRELHYAHVRFGLHQNVGALCKSVTELFLKILRQLNVSTLDGNLQRLISSTQRPIEVETVTPTYEIVTNGVHVLIGVPWQHEQQPVICANGFSLTDNETYASVAIRYGDFGNAVRGAAACVSLLYFLELSDKPLLAEEIPRSLRTVTATENVVLLNILEFEHVTVTLHEQAQFAATVFLRNLYTVALACNAFSSWRSELLQQLYTGVKKSINDAPQQTPYDLYQRHLHKNVWPKLCMFLWVACTARKQPVQDWVTAFVGPILYPPVSLRQHLTSSNDKLEQVRNSTLQMLKVNLDLIQQITLKMYSGRPFGNKVLLQLNKGLRDARIRAVVCACACTFVYFERSESPPIHERDVNRGLALSTGSRANAAFSDTIKMLRTFAQNMHNLLKHHHTAMSNVYDAIRDHIHQLWDTTSDISRTQSYWSLHADMYVLRAMCAAILGHGQDDGSVDLFETFVVIQPQDAVKLLQQARTFARDLQTSMFQNSGVPIRDSIEHTVGSKTTSVTNTRAIAPDDPAVAEDHDIVDKSPAQSEPEPEDEPGQDDGDQQEAGDKQESVETLDADKDSSASEVVLNLVPVMDLAVACAQKYRDAFHTEASPLGVESIVRKLFNEEKANPQKVTTWTDLLVSTSTATQYDNASLGAIDNMWHHLPNRTVMAVDTEGNDNDGQFNLMYPAENNHSIFGLNFVIDAKLHTLEYVMSQNTYSRWWISQPGANSLEVEIEFDIPYAVGTSAFDQEYKQKVRKFMGVAYGTATNPAHPLSLNGKALNRVFKAAGYIDKLISRFCNTVACNPTAVAPPFVSMQNILSVLKPKKDARDKLAQTYDLQKVQDRTDRRLPANPAGLWANDGDILVPGYVGRQKSDNAILSRGFTCLTWRDNLHEKTSTVNVANLIDKFDFTMNVKRLGKALTYVSPDYERVEEGYSAVYCFGFDSFEKRLSETHQESIVAFDAAQRNILLKKHRAAVLKYQDAAKQMWSEESGDNNLLDFVKLLICRSAMGCVTGRRDVQWTVYSQKWVSMPLNDVVQRRFCVRGIPHDSTSKLTKDGQRFVAFINGYVRSPGKAVLLAENGLAYFVCYALQYDDTLRGNLIQWCTDILQQAGDAARYDARWTFHPKDPTETDKLYAADFFASRSHFTRVFYWQIKLCETILSECAVKPFIEGTPAPVIDIETRVAPTQLQPAQSDQKLKVVNGLHQIRVAGQDLEPNLFYCDVKLRHNFERGSSDGSMRSSSAAYHDYFLCMQHVRAAITDTDEQLHRQPKRDAMQQKLYPNFLVDTQPSLAQDEVLHLSAEVTRICAQLDKREPRMEVEFALVINGMHKGEAVHRKCVCPTQPVSVTYQQESAQIVTAFINNKTLCKDLSSLSEMSIYTDITPLKFVQLVQEVCIAFSSHDKIRPIVFDTSAILFFNQLCSAKYLRGKSELGPLVKFAYAALPLRESVGNAGGADKLRKVLRASNSFRELFVAVAKDSYARTYGDAYLTAPAFLQKLDSILTCGHQVFYNAVPYCPVNRVRLSSLPSGAYAETWVWPFVRGFHKTHSIGDEQRFAEFLQKVDRLVQEKLHQDEPPISKIAEMLLVYSNACPNLFLSVEDPKRVCLLQTVLLSLPRLTPEFCEKIVEWVTNFVVSGKNVRFAGQELPYDLQADTADQLETRLKHCLVQLSKSVSPYKVTNRDELDTALRHLRTNFLSFGYYPKIEYLHYDVTHLPETVLSEGIVSKHPSKRVFGLVSVPVIGQSHCRDYFVVYRSDTDLKELTEIAETPKHLSNLHAENRLLTDEEFAAEILANCQTHARVCCTMAAASRFCALLTNRNKNEVRPAEPAQESDLHVASDVPSRFQASLFTDWGQQSPDLTSTTTVDYCGMSWSAFARRALHTIPDDVRDEKSKCWFLDRVEVTYTCGPTNCIYICISSADWVASVQTNVMNGTCEVRMMATFQTFEQVTRSRITQQEFCRKDSALHAWENKFPTLRHQNASFLKNFSRIDTPLTVAFVAIATKLQTFSEFKPSNLKTAVAVLDVITTTKDMTRYCGGFNVSGTACRATETTFVQSSTCAESAQVNEIELAKVITALREELRRTEASTNPESEQDGSNTGVLDDGKPNDESESEQESEQDGSDAESLDEGESEQQEEEGQLPGDAPGPERDAGWESDFALDVATDDDHRSEDEEESDDEREPKDMCASPQQEATSTAHLLSDEFDGLEVSLSFDVSGTSGQMEKDYDTMREFVNTATNETYDTSDSATVASMITELQNTSLPFKDLEEMAHSWFPDEDATLVDPHRIQMLDNADVTHNFIFVYVWTKAPFFLQQHDVSSASHETDLGMLPFVLQTHALQPHARRATSAMTVATGIEGDHTIDHSFRELVETAVQDPAYSLTQNELTCDSKKIYVALDEHAVAKLCATIQGPRVHEWIKAGIVRQFDAASMMQKTADILSIVDSSPAGPASTPELGPASEVQPEAAVLSDSISVHAIAAAARIAWNASAPSEMHQYGQTIVWGNIPDLRVSGRAVTNISVCSRFEGRCVRLAFGNESSPLVPCIETDAKHVLLVPLLRAGVDVPMKITSDNYVSSIDFVVDDLHNDELAKQMMARVNLWMQNFSAFDFSRFLEHDADTTTWKFQASVQNLSGVATPLRGLAADEMKLCFVNDQYYDPTVGIYNVEHKPYDPFGYVFALSHEIAQLYGLLQEAAIAGQPNLPTRLFLEHHWVRNFEQIIATTHPRKILVVERAVPHTLQEIQQGSCCVLLHPDKSNPLYVDFAVLMPVGRMNINLFATSEEVMARARRIPTLLTRGKNEFKLRAAEQFSTEPRETNIYGVVKSPGVMCQVLTQFVKAVTDLTVAESAYIVWKCCMETDV